MSSRRIMRGACAAALLVLVVAGFRALVSCQPSVQAAPPRVLALHCGSLLDVRTGRTQKGVWILVQGERIAAVGPALKPPPGARVVDLTHSTVLPGLIDAHTHLTYHFDPQGHFPPAPTETRVEEERAAAANARATLEAGFTTIRNLGASGLADIHLRDAINRGELPGPRMLVSGEPLLPGRTSPFASLETRVGVVREFVRARIRDGADVIKIFEGVDETGKPLFTEQEVHAAVEEAAKAGRRVAVHAHEAAAIKAAVKGGCASIEHGTFADAEAIQLMAGRHTLLVPTLFLPTHYLSHRAQFDFDPGTWDFFKQLQGQNLGTARRARQAGVRIVCGSDAVAGVHGHNARELEWLVKAGLTPAEAIRAATVDAAALLGWQDRVGEIRPGRFADIIAVPQDPLKDITALQHIAFVLKNGQIVKSPPR